MKKILFLILLCAVTVTAACTSPETGNANRTGNANTANTNTATADNDADNDADTPNDAWLTTKTKLALIADGRTSGFETDVTTVNGVVTLSGKVDTSEAKQAAEQIARGIEGVRSVNNQLQVVPEARRAEVNASDDKIEEGIEKAIDGDANLRGLGLSADSNAGVVTLSGSVDTPEQLLAYSQAVRKVPGVKSVVTTPVQVRNDRTAARR